MAAESKIEYMEVDDLLLDKENPRLPTEIKNQKQQKIIAYIARHEAVEDLMSAIAQNGFFPGEPLVVYRNSTDPAGKFRVIEGNRRLTSVMLLRNPDLCPERRSLKEIAQSAKKANIPKTLPVVKVADRASALPYLGSRHIVGVKEWEPLQKARYMHQLFELTSSSKTPQERYKTVASSIGSGNRSDYIKKNLDALAVYNVMAEADFYGDSDVTEDSFSFGVLYTALDAKPVAGYIGSAKYDPVKDLVTEKVDPIVHPTKLKKSAIRDLYMWGFHKDDQKQTILGESRNIPKLAAVLRSKAATKVLESTENLQLAYEKAGGVEHELQVALNRALKELRYGNSIAANVTANDEVRELAQTVFQQARQLNKALESDSL
jgi:hypothetical protein